MEEKTEGTLIKFSDDTGGSKRPAVQRALLRLEEGVKKRLIRFSKDKCRVLPLGRKWVWQ